MTTPDTAAMRARLQAATPGPWRASQAGTSWRIESNIPCINGLSAWFLLAMVYEPDEAEVGYTDGAIGSAEDRAALIAHAPSDLAALLAAYDARGAEIERLRAEMEAADKASAEFIDLINAEVEKRGARLTAAAESARAAAIEECITLVEAEHDRLSFAIREFVRERKEGLEYDALVQRGAVAVVQKLLRAALAAPATGDANG